MSIVNGIKLEVAEENGTNNKSRAIEMALSLNRYMQSESQALKTQLMNLLHSVRTTYRKNEQLIRYYMKPARNGVGNQGTHFRGGTFYRKGNMYFKDGKCRNCPNNSDYESRHMTGELFPMDLDLQGRHVWTIKDKQEVVLAVKDQVVTYLAQKHSEYDDNSSCKEVAIANSTPSLVEKSGVINSKRLVNLLAMIENDKDFSICWTELSARNLRRRHSPESCEAIWRVYLQPSLKRSAWTYEENEALLNAAKSHKFQDWESIAKQIKGRSDFQCFVQYQNHVCYMMPERWSKWSKEDNDKLIELVSKNTFNGVVNWCNVTSHFPHRPRNSIRAYYSYSLDPSISHKPFTPEEDLLLLAAVKEYGTKFSCFPKTLFPNRSTVQLRCRYNNTIKDRHKYQPWTVADDRRLLEFVANHGTSAWLECERFLGNKHSRTSCRTRFTTIQRYLKKHPDSDIESIPRRKQYTYSHDVTSENWPKKVAEMRESGGKAKFYSLQKCLVKSPQDDNSNR